MKFLRTAALAGGIVSVLASFALADGLIRDGIGPISSGRGGTNIARNDNGAIIYDNPAGMSNIEGDVLMEGGADLVYTDIHFQNALNDVHNTLKGFAAPQVAYMQRVGPDGRLTLGIGAFAPAGFMAEYNMVNPFIGDQNYRSLGMLLKILPAASYQLTDRLSIGATCGVGISHVELAGPYNMQTGILRGAPTQMNIDASGVTPVWSLGLQYLVDEDTTIGVCYNSQSKFGLNGHADASVFGLAPVPISSHFDANLAMTWPRSLGIGATHKFLEQHRVSTDLIWYDWSSAFDQLGMTLSNPTNPVVSHVLGNSIHDTLPLKWRDSVSIRLGYEYYATQRDTFRAGYVYHSPAVPTATLNPYLDGVLQHSVSLGYSRKMRRDWTLNFAYQYMFGIPRTVNMSELAGGEFDHSRLGAQAHWAMMSLMRTY